MTIEQIIENNFKKLGWDSLMEAYYNLELVPFMEIIYDSAKEYAKLMCEKQKEICADNAEADFNVISLDENEPNIGDSIEVYVLRESILQCENATEL